MTSRIIIFVTLFLFTNGFAIAQQPNSEPPKGWHLLNNKEGYWGIGLEKAYQTTLKTKTYKQTVIVAIIDSGVDTTHEDLKSVLWRNKNEIPGNGIDDDHNGYIDDTNGWNFLGNKNGKNVTKDSDEASRVYYLFKNKFGSTSIDTTTFTKLQKSEFTQFQKAKYQIESQGKEAATMVSILKPLVVDLPQKDSILKVALNKNSYTGEDLLPFKPTSRDEVLAKNLILGLFQQSHQMDVSNNLMIPEIISYYEGEKSKLESLEKAPKNYRDDIVGDNYFDTTDRYYGNNDIMASDPSHGTHVAGIIGAVRGNGIGMDGIAEHIKIMAIRAVPDGDEHDKDIANGIRYAVDNGAKVINMSFGKYFSPEKNWVDDAVKYAESKGVLLVHAAGNESSNVDSKPHFPNPNLLEGKKSTNWITVGASGPTNENLVAPFSNYGKNDVDVFSPGMSIYSTLPGSTYGKNDGTSMASPVVAGLAALILSYYPNLTPVEIIQILKQSATRFDGKMVNRPSENEEPEKIPLNSLSASGLINADAALLLADVISSKKNKMPTIAQKKVLPKSTIKKSKKG
jgi:subtilisin family serine protease